MFRIWRLLILLAASADLPALCCLLKFDNVLQNMHEELAICRALTNAERLATRLGCVDSTRPLRLFDVNLAGQRHGPLAVTA